MTAGRGLKRRLIVGSGLLAPELVGSQYGSLKIVSQTTRESGCNLRVEVQCARCQGMHFALFHNIRKRPQTAACPHCNGRQPILVPEWLYHRCQAQLQRCTNPRAASFERYGGRGVEFRFSSVNEAAHWVAENLGVASQEMQLDRVNNNGHYEPGNLRWSTPVQNQNNTRVSGGRQRFIAFRKTHPEVRYADATLARLINTGLTDAKIVERWATPSAKPKGKYGTFSMQGPYRGSLPTDD